jgi:hypothetical protein
MPVTFKRVITERALAPWNEYQRVIALAIQVSRPAGEQWIVTICEPVDAPVIRLDFALAFEAPHSVTFMADSDDDNHTVLYRIVCHFLRKRWPGGIMPS